MNYSLHSLAKGQHRADLIADAWRTQCRGGRGIRAGAEDQHHVDYIAAPRRLQRRRGQGTGARAGDQHRAAYLPAFWLFVLVH